MTLTLSQLAKALNTSLSGVDCVFSQVSINTRTMNKGDLFIAIKGDNFDAHHYIQEAIKKGACAIVLEDNKLIDTLTIRVPYLVVLDSRIALGQIASLWRNTLSLPIVAITGSCGKTTVKEMITAIFKQAKEPILATKGNLNNNIGVPLTLMRLDEKQQMAVIEIGANHGGEIDQLVQYVAPDVAVITNAAHAHIEGFGSLEGVAHAKAEIYNGIKECGTAVINADDEFSDYWLNYCQTHLQKKLLQCLTFGLDQDADISADYKQSPDGTDLTLQTPKGNINVMLKHYGKHTVYNALASSAVALSVGCTLTHIKQGLEAFNNISGRLEQKQGIADTLIFDDSYNANPDSVRAGIDALQQLEGHTFVILGDMGELGQQSESLHYQLGLDMAKMGVTKLLTLGHDSEATCKGFLSIKKDQATHFFKKEALIDDVKNYLYHRLKSNKKSKINMLVKGSRSMSMETIVDQLLLKESNNISQIKGVQ